MTTTLVIQNGEDDAVTTDISSYSVSEDATPVIAGDTRGGVGSIDMGFGDFDGAEDLVLRSVRLEDTYNGVTSGTVNGADGDGLDARFRATSRLVALVNEVSMPPYVGTLGAYITLCLESVGVFEDPTIDPATAALPVSFMAWRGILWDKLKELAVLYRFEMNLVSDRVTVRPLRGRLAENANNASFRWSVDTTNLATNFKVAHYNLTPVENVMVYPISLRDATIISFGPTDIFETTVETGVSLTSVQQPVISSGINKYDEGTESVYTVIDGEGRIISPQEWLSLDGFLTVEIDPEDEQQSRIIIRAGGGGDVDTGPYKLAIRGGGENSTYDYSSLRIFGSGVAYEREEIEIGTGVPASYAGSIDGPVVDTQFAANRAQAFQLATSAVSSLTQPRRSVDVETGNINRRGETGSLAFPTYADFAAEYTTESYADFQALMGDKTYEEFYNEYLAQSVGNFENQAFGNIAGARVRFGHAFLRIISATTTEGSISYTAESDTLYSDFAAEMPDEMTYADFAALWGSKTYIDFGARPLWH